MSEWADDNPFFLVISPHPIGEEERVVIDLGTPWLTTHAAYLRRPGLWELVHKETNHTVMAVVIYDGEQPYYSAHHVGITGSGSNEIVAYGIGKKKANGETVRMWLLPNGALCSNDDVDTLGIMLVRQLGPR